MYVDTGDDALKRHLGVFGLTSGNRSEYILKTRSCVWSNLNEGSCPLSWPVSSALVVKETGGWIDKCPVVTEAGL